jgi:hypothetical protein
MIIMRLCSIIIVVTLFSCRSSITNRAIDIDESFIGSVYNDKPILLISCIKCGCFIDILSKPTNELTNILSKYEIYADSACTDKKILPFHIRHIPQLKIDSIFSENYNLIIVNKSENTFRARLIETDGSSKLDKILSTFLE